MIFVDKSSITRRKWNNLIGYTEDQMHSFCKSELDIPIKYFKEPNLISRRYDISDMAFRKAINRGAMQVSIITMQKLQRMLFGPNSVVFYTGVPGENLQFFTFLKDDRSFFVKEKLQEGEVLEFPLYPSNVYGNILPKEEVRLCKVDDLKFYVFRGYAQV